jgi:hypothetical protein
MLKTVWHEGVATGYELTGADSKRLKLFFISLLWRASVSTHSFYKRVSIGPWEEHARKMVRAADPGKADEFGVVLAKFDARWGNTILNPHAGKLVGINYVQFYLGGFVGYIKTDRRQWPEPLSQFLVTPESCVLVVGRDTAGSPELPVLREMARQPKNARFTQRRNNDRGTS